METNGRDAPSRYGATRARSRSTTRPTRSWKTVLLAAAATAFLGVRAAAEPGPDATYEEKVQPILERHCYACHGKEKHKADLDLTRFKTTADVLHEHALWKTVVGRINLHEMPPKSKPQLAHGDMELVDRWFNGLPKGKSDCNELANDENLRWYRGFVLGRRITHSEYDNSIRDLTGLDLKPSRAFPDDGSGGEGFHTAGNSLYTSTILIERYLESADRVLDAVFRGREPDASPAEREAFHRVVSAQRAEGMEPREAARKCVGELARRAFRRPVRPEEVERLLTLYDPVIARGAAYEEALRQPLRAVLVSPHFLFLPEPEPEAAGVYRLDDFQIATRLASFIWSSLPDAELSSRAEQGGLRDAETIRGEVRRMLRDPKARALGEDFALAWLELEPLGSTARPDPQRFPEFDASLERALREEAVQFFHDLIANDRSLLELIDSKYTFLNERLARHYGVPGVEGVEMRRVELPDRNRGGVLGMGAVQVVTSFPTRTSPVLRGKWVLETLLGSRVPPPPQAASLAEAGAATAEQTLRQRLELHRTQPECATCHDRMDPLGFGLENFDAVGKWRTSDGGQPLDVHGKLPSGEDFSGAAELKQVLLARKDEFAAHFVRKLLGYALGRDLNRFDECVVDDAVKALRDADYRCGVVFEAIAVSFPFQNRHAKK